MFSCNSVRFFRHFFFNKTSFGCSRSFAWQQIPRLWSSLQCLPVRNRAIRMVCHFLLPQQPPEINAAPVSVYHHLEHPVNRPSISSLCANGCDTVSCSPVPQAGRLSVGRERSLAIKIRCPGQNQLSISLTYFKLTLRYQIVLHTPILTLKRRVANPFRLTTRLHFKLTLFYKKSFYLVPCFPQAKRDMA